MQADRHPILSSAGHESGEDSVQVYREAVEGGQLVYCTPTGTTPGAFQ